MNSKNIAETLRLIVEQQVYFLNAQLQNNNLSLNKVHKNWIKIIFLFNIQHHMNKFITSLK